MADYAIIIFGKKSRLLCIENFALKNRQNLVTIREKYVKSNIQAYGGGRVLVTL